MSASGEAAIVDFAIVGGGVSGLYAAWRLLSTAERTPSVILLERETRLGGRLLSVHPPRIESGPVELGGMRFIPKSQPWVNGLVGRLGLTTERLLADEPGNICYLRGKRLQMADLADSTRLPYDLDGRICNEDTLNSLVAWAAVETLAETIKTVTGKEVKQPADLQSLTESDRRDVTIQGTYNGMSLYEIPLRYLLLHALGIEGLALAQDAGGYDSVLHTWNAADGIWSNVAHYGQNVVYERIAGGYAKLTLALSEQAASAGCKIRQDTRAISFDCEDGTGIISLVVSSPGGSETIQTRNLILALPRRSLELLEPTGAILGRESMQRLIGAVTPIPLFKLAICYEAPWWQATHPHIRAGRSTTDLPIRQCFYWSVDKRPKHAVILTYDDGDDLDYWADLRASKRVKDPENFAAPMRMIKEVHRQLVELHNARSEDVPNPYAAVYRDWSDDPFGGGANFWSVGERSYKVSRDIRQPDKRYRVYICGEAYSHAQGWVEGALRTTEATLQRIGLKPPAWAPFEAAIDDLA